MLHGQKRYNEFAGFFDWLAELIKARCIDVLLVSGDIFDTTTPSNRAQQLYYQFLCKIAASDCSHVVIIAGNHDSPTFLNAPKELLLSLNVHVVGSIDENLEKEVIVLSDSFGLPEAIVCAVPYLRDRDIRKVTPGESIAGTDIKILGIKNKQIVLDLILRARQEQTLDDLNEIDVFNRLLDTFEIEGNERQSLMHSYKEIITIINEKDINAT